MFAALCPAAGFCARHFRTCSYVCSMPRQCVAVCVERHVTLHHHHNNNTSAVLAVPLAVAVALALAVATQSVPRLFTAAIENDLASTPTTTPARIF